MSAVPLPRLTRSWRHRPRPRPATVDTVRSLKNIRWAVRAALVIGVAASVGANILHAQPHPISQAIAAWPPIALLLTVELISRVPVHRRLLAAARLLATTAIAGIAAWVSYWHMVGVAARYGETGLSAYLLPISVDGLVVVATISLVELSARLHLAQSKPPPPTPTARARTAPTAAEPPAANPADHPPTTRVKPAPSDNDPLAPPPQADPAAGDQPSPDASADPDEPAEPDDEHPPSPGSPDTDDDASPHGDDAAGAGAARQRRPRGTTRKAVIEAHLADPAKHPTTIAEEIGTSERNVRRYLSEFRAAAGRISPNGSNGAGHGHNGHPR